MFSRIASYLGIAASSNSDVRPTTGCLIEGMESRRMLSGTLHSELPHVENHGTEVEVPELHHVEKETHSVDVRDSNKGVKHSSIVKISIDGKNHDSNDKSGTREKKEVEKPEVEKPETGK